MSPAQIFIFFDVSPGWLEKLERAVEADISLSPWSLHEAHLGTLVSSSQIFYLAANFQEGQRPRMSHLPHSIGQSLTEGQGIQRGEM